MFSRIAEIDAWPPINAWWSKGQRKLTEDGGVVMNLGVALTHGQLRRFIFAS